MKPSDPLRTIPAVDELLRMPEIASLGTEIAPALLVSWIREIVGEIRSAVLAKTSDGAGLERDLAAIPDRLRARAAALRKLPVRRVVNATGVLVHTNLGRAPLASGALDAVRAAGGSYVNLEYDITRGERGSRSVHLAAVAEVLFPGRGALAVNNNAAAVLLVLNTLAEGREVIIARGELVEIGGSFRIPEVMAKAGARLCEVGTTNKTRISDYRAAITERTGLLVKVHTSNYRILGFVEETSISDLAALGRERGVPVFVDEGSGNLQRDAEGALENEPSVPAFLAAGASIVTFSGDKLLGGPQAGLIVGDPSLVARCAGNPLARALRIDKLTLAALAWTLAEHASGRAAATVPLQTMLARSASEIEVRARAIAARLTNKGALAEATIEDGSSRAGGGAAPLREIPTHLLALRPTGKSVSRVEELLRGNDPPIIARIDSGRLLIDLRTVDPMEDGLVAAALERALQ